MFEMEIGEVKWFSIEKNYGFLSSANGGPDLFAHGSNVLSSVQLRQGQRVSYEVKPGRDGRLKAANIRIV
jgi:CspA family cold shock protein